ncbi:MAG: YbhB/YbcL family Raf kinase inhibitor-like protein [Maritimibacter sp.]
MRLLSLITAIFTVAASAAEADMKLSFNWGDIPLCTSGQPNIVPNPVFELSGLPVGTTYIAFKLTDLDVPQYNHGGGTVEMTQDGTIAPGAFTYKSPCPPGAVHSYQWQAVALGPDGPLEKATATRRYPE